jgi:hypothetical protein
LKTLNNNRIVAKHLWIVSLGLFAITLTHWALGTDGSFWQGTGSTCSICGVCFYIASFLEEK